jgi:hypothetical protein
LKKASLVGAPGRSHCRSYSGSSSSVPSVGLCLTAAFFFFLRSGTTRDTGKAPIRSRDISFTACTALNRLIFFFLDAMPNIMP